MDGQSVATETILTTEGFGTPITSSTTTGTVGVEWDTNNLNNMELPATPEWTTADGISDASPLIGSVLKKTSSGSGWDADARSVGVYLGGSGTALESVITSYESFRTANYLAFKEHDGNFAAGSEDASDILGWYCNNGCMVKYYGSGTADLFNYNDSIDPFVKLKIVLETDGTTTFWHDTGSGYTLDFTDSTDRTGEEYKVWSIIYEDNGENVTQVCCPEIVTTITPTYYFGKEVGIEQTTT
ncbi:MAG TPA: hypothetical protein EYO31_08835, partial [Phycisphaerales bacterium]|nr:hypothetical protein [Phycisphaerales bacterium]